MATTHRIKATFDLADQITCLRRLMPVTPLRRLDDTGLELYAKVESGNPFGSIKDRTALFMLDGAIRRGEITHDSTIVESSSGNMAVALTGFCRMLDLDFIAVIDPNISPVNEAIIREGGARVIKVDRSDEFGGYLWTRLKTVRHIVEEIPHAFWTNQYANPDGMAAHYQTTGREICEQAGQIDYVFIAVSSGGTVSGVSRCVKERFHASTVVAVDVVGSAIFGGPVRKRTLPGIGASLRSGLLDHARIDEVVKVTEEEMVRGCHELLRRYRLCVGASSGAAYASVRQYFAGRVMGHRPRVVFICPDGGERYAETVFNPGWYLPFLGRSHGLLHG